MIDPDEILVRVLPWFLLVALALVGVFTIVCLVDAIGWTDLITECSS